MIPTPFLQNECRANDQSFLLLQACALNIEYLIFHVLNIGYLISHGLNILYFISHDILISCSKYWICNILWSTYWIFNISWSEYWIINNSSSKHKKLISPLYSNSPCSQLELRLPWPRAKLASIHKLPNLNICIQVQSSYIQHSFVFFTPLLQRSYLFFYGNNQFHSSYSKHYTGLPTKDATSATT